MEEPKGRIILLDWGYYQFCAINAWGATFLDKQKDPNVFLATPSWYLLNMLFAHLKAVGVTPFDRIMIATDYKKSWRYRFDPNYKANRKGQREKQTHIDWNRMFAEMNDLLDRLNQGTTFHILREESFEADDWMASACRYYKDQEVILIVSDADLEQMLVYPHVKIFSPKSKKYKFNANPFKDLAKKLEKEKADNLNEPIKNETEYDVRKLIVSLLELPDFVEHKCIEVFKSLQEKEDNVELIPSPSMKLKYQNLYENQKVVPFKQTIKRKRRKKK